METNLMPFLVWDEQLDTALDNISNGNTSEGHIVMSHFVHALDTANTPDPRASKFIIEALKEIVLAVYADKDIDFEKIFRIRKLVRGRPPLSGRGKYERALKYTCEIAQHIQSGNTELKAMELVAKKYNKSIKNIHGYYTYFHKIAGN